MKARAFEPADVCRGTRLHGRALVEPSLQQSDLVGAPVRTGICRHIANAAVCSTSLDSEAREASNEPLSARWPTDAAMGLPCLESG